MERSERAKMISPIAPPSPSPPLATDSTRTPSNAMPDGSPDPLGSQPQTSVKSTEVIASVISTGTPAPKQARKRTAPGKSVIKAMCPAQGCKHRGSSEDLSRHWRNAHEDQVAMWLCPLPQCGMQLRNALQISMHLRKIHNLSRGQTRSLETLPLLVELLKNHTYRYPGVDRPAELEAPALRSTRS